MMYGLYRVFFLVLCFYLPGMFVNSFVVLHSQTHSHLGVSYVRKEVIICGSGCGVDSCCGVYLMDAKRIDSSREVYVYIFACFHDVLSIVVQNGVVESVLVIGDLQQDECIVIGSNETRKRGLFIIGVEFCDKDNRIDFTARSIQVRRAWVYNPKRSKKFVEIRGESLVRFNEGYYERKRVTRDR